MATLLAEPDVVRAAGTVAFADAAAILLAVPIARHSHWTSASVRRDRNRTGEEPTRSGP